MATRVQKIKASAMMAVTADKVMRRSSGDLVFRRGFFYRHGGDADKWAGTVIGRLAEHGVKATCVESHERWQAWPKDSYWQATVQVDEEALVAYGESVIDQYGGDWHDVLAEMS